MKYKLIESKYSIKDYYTALDTVLVHRGIAYKDIPHYLHTTDEDICDFNLLGEEKLKNAATEVIRAINLGLKMSVVVD